MRVTKIPKRSGYVAEEIYRKQWPLLVVIAVLLTAVVVGLVLFLVPRIPHGWQTAPYGTLFLFVSALWMLVIAKVRELRRGRPRRDDSIHLNL